MNERVGLNSSLTDYFKESIQHITVMETKMTLLFGSTHLGSSGGFSRNLLRSRVLKHCFSRLQR